MKKRSFLISSSFALLALVLGLIIVHRTIHKEKDKSLNKQPLGYKAKYSLSIVPDKMTIPEKKERFKQLLVPATKHVFLQLEQQYKRVSENIENGEHQTQIDNLKKEYRAETDKELLMALKPHPVSIVLAQAALESSWGTSRFFVEANNVFGVWSFDPNESRVKAGKKRGGKIIWVKKYDDLETSIRDYYRVIGRGVAFKEFRKLRIETNDPFKLVVKLQKYSEKREEYGEELSSMIRYNKFTQFDNP
ncbi:glucosaminidase domain-containing protein [bacterium]|nr:glucosaminidase domain-containing protein [bacterium]